MKKYLLGLLVVLGLGITSFSSAGSYTFTGSFSKTRTSNIYGGSRYNIYQMPIGTFQNTHFGISSDCVISNISSSVNISALSVGFNVFSNSSQSSYSYTTSCVSDSSCVATVSNNEYVPINFVFQVSFSEGGRPSLSFDYSCVITYDFQNICDYSGYVLENDITENYCSNKFSSLMTFSECDSLYTGYVSPTIYQNCTNSLNSCSGELGICNGNLNSCLNGNYSGDIQWSSIWINDIQHLGNKNIYIQIPEEINWDYSYTGDNMNVDIEGYNVDYEYMAGVIETQNYQPTSEDLTKIFALFKEFGGLLVACLFIIFVFYFIKKAF